MVCTQLKILVLLHNHWNRKWVYLHVFVTRSHEFYSRKSIVARVPEWIFLKQILPLGQRILCSRDKSDCLIRKSALIAVCNITAPPRKYPISSLKHINSIGKWSFGWSVSEMFILVAASFLTYGMSCMAREGNNNFNIFIPQTLLLSYVSHWAMKMQHKSRAIF